MMKLLASFLLVIFSLIPFLSISQNSGTLVVEITSLRNDDGLVAVSIHNGEEGFPGGTETMVRGVSTTIKNGKAVLEFKNLPYGEYAISAFHDENSNKELDTNWIGIPKEGIAASNDAKGRMGPPRYKDAKFIFKEDGQKTQFKMAYI